MNNPLSRREALRYVGGSFCGSLFYQLPGLSGVRVSSVASSGASHDDVLDLCARQAVGGAIPLILDLPLYLKRKWTPPEGLVLRGDGTTQSSLHWRGQGDAIEIAKAIDLDGVTFEGGMDPSEDRSNAVDGCLVGIHGDMSGAGRFLSGVKIGHIRIRRTHTIGLALANLEGFHADQIDLEDIYSNGMLISGLKNSSITAIRARNIGDLRKTQARRGAAVGAFTEQKHVAEWYSTTAILRTDMLSIGTADIESTTDTSFYVHDDLKTGVSNLTIGTVSVKVSGKDGFKIRTGPSNVKVQQVTTDRTALRGIDLDGVHNISIDQIHVTNSGYDSIGVMMQHPSVFSGGGGQGESFQMDPEGMQIAECDGIVLGSVEISGVAANPVTGAEGHGIHLTKSTNVKMAGTMSNIDGNGIRIAGSSSFDITFDVTNPCRKGGQKAAILVTDDNAGPNTNGTIRGHLHQAPGGHAVYALEVSTDACNIRSSLSYSRSEFPGGVRNDSSGTCR